ncbi:MAG: hypothetical protein WBG69_04995 [Arcobacteraceae bacterium]
MNILVIDKENVIINTFNFIKQMESTWNILVYDGKVNTYNHDIHFVVVDFSTQSNKDILDDIIQINPKQKTITVSENLVCSDTDGCNHCVVNYDRRRILKPIDAKLLYETIKFFDEEECNYSRTNSFQNIDDILPNVLKRFLTYSYNETTQILKPKTHISQIHITRDMLEIIEILKKHHIQYTLVDDTEIKIK